MDTNDRDTNNPLLDAFEVESPTPNAVSLGTSGSSPTKPFVEPWPIRDFELAQLDADMEKEVADLSKTGHLLIVARRIIATLRHERERHDAAIMNAIEATVLACDEDERKRIPGEARVIDYAKILRESVARAARSSGGTDNG